MTKGQRNMTDYILMPEGATPEMEQAAEKYWNDRKFKALSDDPRTWKGLYAAMRAAAPAVQGEPVGYARPHQMEALLSGKVCGITMEDKPDTHNRVTVPLYVSPHPAEQKPVPDVAQLVEALEDIGASWHGVNTELERYMRNVARKALATYRNQGGAQ